MKQEEILKFAQKSIYTAVDYLGNGTVMKSGNRDLIMRSIVLGFLG